LEGVHDGIHTEESPVRSAEARVGVRVRIRSSCRKHGLRGAVGTIANVWGTPHCALVEVRLDAGKLELLWRDELEKVREEVREGVFVQLRWG
jgi:hypothetical protein